MATKRGKTLTTKEARNEILAIMLQRTGLTKKDIHDVAEQDFVANNLDLLTTTEKRHYKELGFIL